MVERVRTECGRGVGHGGWPVLELDHQGVPGRLLVGAAVVGRVVAVRAARHVVVGVQVGIG